MGMMIVILLMGSNEVGTSQVCLGAALLLLNSFVSLRPKLEKSERLIGKRRDQDRRIPLIEWSTMPLLSSFSDEPLRFPMRSKLVPPLYPPLQLNPTLEL